MQVSWAYHDGKFMNFKKKSFKIVFLKMFQNVPADFHIYGVSRHDKPDYDKISGRRGNKLWKWEKHYENVQM